MPNPPREPEAAAFILAGGQSSRMGTEKSLALFCGIPLIQSALQVFAECGLRAGIAGARSDLSAFAAVIPDIYPDCGPLSGIHAALAASSSPWNIFLPVDTPLMPPSLLLHLLRQAKQTRAPVTVAQLNGSLQPFPVVLHRNTLALLEARLIAGDTGCQAAWRSISIELGSPLNPISVEVLHQTGQCSHPSGFEPRWWFQSANTPAELARLNELARYPLGNRVI